MAFWKLAVPHSHIYDHHDVEFLTSIANIAAAAVDTMKRDVALRVAADHLQDVIDDRQRLGEARNLLLAENIRLVNDRRFLREDLQHGFGTTSSLSMQCSTDSFSRHRTQPELRI